MAMQVMSINDFLFYAWSKEIIPFLLPSHTTHLLQLLDIGIFQPMKHWHQMELHAAIQFGDLQFSKVDFLNVFQKIRNNTFKAKTIYSAWRKSGLVPYKPDVVFKVMENFESTSISASTSASTSVVQAPIRPVTPPNSQPFQKRPLTRDRPAHEAYINRRLLDICVIGEENEPLTPSFYRSWRMLQLSTNAKVLSAQLIIERDFLRVEAEKERLRRKAGSGKYVKKHGVIYKGVAAEQIEERLEEAHKVWSAAQERKIKRVDKFLAKTFKNVKKITDEWYSTRDYDIYFFD